MDKRRRKPFSVPPVFYFKTAGGFHPIDYNRCLVVSVSCPYCLAKRGEFCMSTHVSAYWKSVGGHRPTKGWENCSHGQRKSAFAVWRKRNRVEYEKLRRTCFQQYEVAYQNQILPTHLLGCVHETELENC